MTDQQKTSYITLISNELCKVALIDDTYLFYALFLFEFAVFIRSYFFSIRKKGIRSLIRYHFKAMDGYQNAGHVLYLHDC